MILTHGSNSISRGTPVPEFEYVLMPDNKLWTKYNLDIKWEGLVLGSSSSSSEQRANYYNNNEATYGVNGRKCGLLYNWIAAKYLEDNKATIIPGWNVPTIDDWNLLITSVGGTSVAGQKLKAVNVPWQSQWGGTDDYGFSALPSGVRTSSNFSYDSVTLALWTSTENDSSRGKCVYIERPASATTSSEQKLYQFSIRLCRPYTENIGGKDYKCVKMPDGKIWMAENLDYAWSGLDIGGTSDPGTNPHAWYYDNNTNFDHDHLKYGLLYNWYATKYLEDNKSTLCPGWHVPTSAELSALVTAVGSTPGTKLKSTSNWYNSGNGSDAYGFDGKPTGIVNPGSSPMFDLYQKVTTFQCITLYGTDRKYGLSLYDNDTNASVYYNYGFPQGNSIRLVKD